MTAVKLRAFAAGLGVRQRDPTTGKQCSKAELLDAVLQSLLPQAAEQAWWGGGRFILQELSVGLVFNAFFHNLFKFNCVFWRWRRVSCL